MKRAIATALVCALWACASEPEPPQHVVLITLDTTRADHLGAYGSTVSTPHLDALAAESVVFEQAAAACTTTLPSHVSLMSGRWPLFHGVARNGYVVSRENVMLAEILAGAGFRSIGVSAALELSDLVDFSQGFDVWDQDPESYAGHVVANRDARRAEEITDAAISLLDEAGDERLFLFVHYVDPHAPYDPPEPFRSAHGDVPEGLVGDFAEVRRAKRLHRGTALEPPNPRGGLPNLLDETVTGRTRRRAVGNDALLARLYAGEVSYMDHHLGRLLRELRERGLSEDALVIVTADHGETFWEHEDLWSHGLAVYDTNARIPLIVRFPGGRYAGSRVEAVVSNVDVLPTILDLLGLESSAPIDGRSLLPLLDRGPRIDGMPHQGRPAFTQAPLSGGSSDADGPGWINRNKPHSIRKGRWKYVRTAFLEKEELFDLDADPGEQRNLLLAPSPDSKRLAQELRSELDAWIASSDPLPSEWFPRKNPSHKDPQGAERKAMWERLRSLGYISGESQPDDRQPAGDRRPEADARPSGASARPPED